MYHLLYRRKELTEDQKQELCIKCQFCCRYMIRDIIPHPDRQAFNNAWGLMSITDGQHMAVMLPHACQQITDTGCKIYKDRPEVCKKFQGGDTERMWIPFCLWYEPLPENEKAALLKKWAPSPEMFVK